MIEKLLYEIRRGGPLELKTLASHLGTSPEMVTAMLEHLQRLGYIQPYGETCGTGCGGCAFSQACSINPVTSQIRLWRT
jgi:hypothetical protein